MNMPLPQNFAELNFTSLFGLWQARDSEEWSTRPDLYRAIIKRSLKLGEPLLAYDAAMEGLEHWPEDLELRQQLALALMRSGASRRAVTILRQLYREGFRDEETLGLLARTYKEAWTQATNSSDRKEQLRRTFEAYNEAYTINGGYWTGINTATIALLSGDDARAQALAREVRDVCLRELDRLAAHGDADSYWLEATIGEAALILGDEAEASSRYSRAARAGRGRYGEFASTRRNARFIINHHGGDQSWIEQYLRIPRVVVFSGHMIDRPHRREPRFPPSYEQRVKELLRERLKKLDAGFGYASAASGSDILFLETLLELGGEIHIVLPYNKDQFLEDSVMDDYNKGWKERYELILRKAAQVVTASEQKLGEGGMSYKYANLMLLGLAGIRAEQLDTELRPLAVWDGGPGDGDGGTADAIAHWRGNELPIEIVDLRLMPQPEKVALAELACDESEPAQALSSTARSEFRAEIMGILFADALHFSQLTESQLPLFLRHFMGAIGELTRSSPYAPVIKNTWGDGLYFVFSKIVDAGRFALELCDLMNRTNWAEMGLPRELNLRIALHAGPVYACIDPVTRQANYIGTHVSHAARIEPITPPGQVYASQAFASLSYAQPSRDYTCEYVGQTPLAKGHGTFPTYHVQPLKD